MTGQGVPLEVLHDPARAALALAPERVPLLRALSEQDDSASSLARRLGLTRQRVNYHLRELEKQGLVEVVEERRKGNCTERVMRAKARAFLVSPAVLGAADHPAPEVATDRFSSAYLVGAAARALHEVAVLRERAAAAGLPLATLTLQAEVRFASAEARAAFAEELAATLARLVSTYHDDAAPAGRPYRFLVGGYPVATDAGAPAAPSQHEETSR